MARALPLESWLINHFRVLPTDERYQQLSDKQKLLLLAMYLEHPTDQQLHDARFSSQALAPDIDDGTEQDLRAGGYSAQQIARIKQQLEAAAERM